jgi:hypothetical protein
MVEELSDWAILRLGDCTFTAAQFSIANHQIA